MDEKLRADLVAMKILEDITDELTKKMHEYSTKAKDETSPAGNRLCDISRANGIGESLDVIIAWRKVLMDDAKKRTEESNEKAS